MIPGRLRIDDNDGTSSANAKTVGFSAEHLGLSGGETEFLEALLEIVPGFETVGPSATLGFGLVGAKKDVPFDARKV